MARHDPHGEEDLGERFSQFASVCGITDGHDLRSANDTPALNALKALRGAPISMGRGETPVGCCQRPSGFAISLMFIFDPITAPCYNKHKFVREFLTDFQEILDELHI